ncbi:hypothetical protein Celaphus_00010200, partial [Cervus elaphus hippelaphus]
RRLTRRGSKLVASSCSGKLRLVPEVAPGSGHFLMNTHLDRWSMLTRLENTKGRRLAVFIPCAPGL